MLKRKVIRSLLCGGKILGPRTRLKGFDRSEGAVSNYSTSTKPIITNWDEVPVFRKDECYDEHIRAEL